MARRATLDRGASRTAAEDSLLPDSGPAPRRRPSAGPWRGSGGRWLVWLLRGVVWLVILIIGYRGVMAIVAGPASTPAVAPSTSRPSTFPVTLAQAYALEFGDVYLNFSPATASTRSAMLAPFLPPGSDPQLGWNGAGTQHLQSEQVASVQVRGDHYAIITLLAVITNKVTKTIELGVPIYASGGGLVVSGEPALLSGPARAVPPAAAPANSDSTTASALQAQLPSFFRAYASGDQNTLGRFLASGASVSGLGGAVTYGSIQSITVPYGGATRVITVVVVWNLSSASSGGRSSPTASASPSVTMAYRMTVARQGTTWYVQSIGASPQSSGPP